MDIFALILLRNIAVLWVPAALAAWASFALARTSRDEWKLLVWVPVLPLTIWGAIVAWDSAKDPTSHNLAPLEFIVWVALTLVLFALVVIARRAFGGPRTGWSARRDRASQPPSPVAAESVPESVVVPTAFSAGGKAWVLGTALLILALYAASVLRH